MYENSDFVVLRFGECFASDNRLKVKEVCKRTCFQNSKLRVSTFKICIKIFFPLVLLFKNLFSGHTR